MKKDLVFAPLMLLIGIALFMLRLTGMPAHIAVSAVGAFKIIAGDFSSLSAYCITSLCNSL